MSEEKPLRPGWTTGTCATAATRAAVEALVTGHLPDPVTVTLPGGQRPSFSLAFGETGEGFARAGVVKDAGDDPDVTHGAVVVATVRPGAPGTGVTFRAGEGVGTVTRPGLPVAVGEPAINPVPRAMIRAAIAEVCAVTGAAGDIEVVISVPNGEALAQKTLNPRLGIVGGLSILGTTGIVVPFSCAAWIHAIHRGVDVARAAGLSHIAGATGSTSEAAIAALDGLPEIGLIDMGDFVGGLLKYVRLHPVERVTVAGGFAKMTKFSQGLLDLHSRAGEVDLSHLARLAGEAGASRALVEAIPEANTALEVLQRTQAEGIDIAAVVAARAVATGAALLRGTNVGLDVVVFGRTGALLARTPVVRG
ncbi:cobalt-precorrin-5B (C(1))-methyltransferase [Rhodoplanes elegans]|uniref:Cobalt-precorrin-5B C(1)-methyltransferase n=1 Tax=Rhodoplanes elegans TaxID=29408 RepID=A0A327KLW8_9BRAD|nr:cobalt-precorrin-5B (C(1))-methyltransferase [Rhodoplanes elegans]MBK5959964.1 cobalt-precorrin-5B (C(1))-methyltransferase [Rhodoplanes elegans]RAI38272.1 cobalt-precorrin-5B (C(1))-methyltransferase [Rhodoplanes elegans]